METKKWEDYNKEEQTNYLVYWFNYYGNLIYNFEELEDFTKLAKTRQDDIFDHIITRSIYENTIQSGMLLTCMRNNKVEELFKTNLTREKIKEAPPEVLSEYEGIREEIICEITGVNEKETPKNK